MTTLRRRYHANPDSTMNITPLVDVMLVLMILFLIAAPVLAHQLPVTLAQKGNPPPAPPPVVHVRMEGDGAIRWDDRVLVADAIDAQIAYEVARVPQPIIEVDAHDDVAYADVIALTHRLDAAGIETLTFKSR